MIRYALKCENDHQFESWFKSSEAFDQLARNGLVDCPQCSSSSIEKTLMAPRVPAKSNKPEVANLAPTQPMASGPDPKIEKALKELRAHVESNSEYVGPRFAAEATSMHLGDKPSRSIYGEVNPEEAKRMAEDGVPAMPLPFVPKQKTN